MVEQICEKCGVRYSLYAPQCPKCGAPSTAPAKKPGCPQAPAAPKPAPKAPKPESTQEKPAETPSKAAPTCDIVVEASAPSCPCKSLAIGALALIGVAAIACGIVCLIRK